MSVEYKFALPKKITDCEECPLLYEYEGCVNCNHPQSPFKELIFGGRIRPKILPGCPFLGLDGTKTEIIVIDDPLGGRA